MKGSKRWQARGRDKIGGGRDNLHSCLLEKGYISMILWESALDTPFFWGKAGVCPERKSKEEQAGPVAPSHLCAQEVSVLQKPPISQSSPPCSSGSEVLQGPRTQLKFHTSFVQILRVPLVFSVYWSVRTAYSEKTKSFSFKELIFWSKLAFLETWSAILLCSQIIGNVDLKCCLVF